MPKLRKRGEVWHYSFTVAGKRIRKSAETPDRSLAQEIALRHELRLRRAAAHGEKAELTFAEAINLYLDHKPSARFLAPLLERFGRWKVAQIDQPAVRKAARELLPSASPATWNRQVVTPVRAVINFAAEEGLCDHFRIKRFPEGGRKARPAGDKTWLAAFQKQARKQDLHRLAALARFMFETGARVGQCCQLTWSDIDLQAGAAVLRTRKTGASGAHMEERTAYLTRNCVADIANLSDRHPRLVFGYASRSTLHKTWSRVVAKAGIAPLTCHEAGRHGFATEAIVRAGLDVATAADLGGWKSRRLMMETYVHSDAGRETIEKVFGDAGKRRNKR